MKSRSDFQNLRSDTFKVFLSDYLMIVGKKNSSGSLRVGWTIPRKFGKAVVRNRFKRWLKFYFKDQTISRLSSGYDINVIFRKPKTLHPKCIEYSSFLESMDRLWKSIDK